MPPRSDPLPERPPVENWMIMPGQCLRSPSLRAAKRSGSEVGVWSSLRTCTCAMAAPASKASCVDSICSETVIGTAGLSSLRGTDPVMATVMMQGSAKATVWPGITTGGGNHQPPEVMGPAFFMTGTGLSVRQTAVGQTHQRAIGLVDQIDLDQARSGWHLFASLPAKAISEAVDWNDLGEPPARDVLAADIDEIETTGMGIHRRLGAHPAHDLFRIGQEREDGGRRCRDLNLTPDHQRLSHRKLLQQEMSTTFPPWARNGKAPSMSR